MQAAKLWGMRKSEKHAAIIKFIPLTCKGDAIRKMRLVWVFAMVVHGFIIEVCNP